MWNSKHATNKIQYKMDITVWVSCQFLNLIFFEEVVIEWSRSRSFQSVITCLNSFSFMCRISCRFISYDSCDISKSSRKISTFYWVINWRKTKTFQKLMTYSIVSSWMCRECVRVWCWYLHNFSDAGGGGMGVVWLNLNLNSAKIHLNSYLYLYLNCITYLSCQWFQYLFLTYLIHLSNNRSGTRNLLVAFLVFKIIFT